MAKMVIPSHCLSCHFMHVSSTKASSGTTYLAVLKEFKIVSFVCPLPNDH